ncbi:MAG: ATP-dependent Clp protease proteolytic subunit [Micrococcales bacterium]|nr:ATP-dependent Clp protease proteolytic subunit [Micrococcales bacterium]MCL2666864.1 ATP-dependent Clp protease proteolytic subunit [Micrococcales bacterium]
MNTQHANTRTEGPGFGLNDHIYTRLLRERIIWLGAEVRDENASAIASQMMLLAAEDPDKDIWLYINSPGGSITAGMVIYDAMQYIEPDVATIAMGMAASMGQFLLSSGAKGKRYATPHARVMMHQPSGGISGTATDVRINAQLIMHMKRTLAELTAEQTGQPLDKVLSDADRDRWFTANEAMEYGFIDHVVTQATSVAGGGGTSGSTKGNGPAKG